MIVKFEDRYGNQREIGVAKTIEEANKIIKQFLLDKNYNSPYWRISYFPDYRWIDVGSWSEFFYIYPENEEEKRAMSYGGNQ